MAGGSLSIPLAYQDLPCAVAQAYLNLQLRYLIVKGGNLTIGTADKPYVNRANITFIGLPNSLDLPLYGAKSMAVRDGVVTMYGQPKTPLYTTLNATVNKDDTTITVNGATNWQVRVTGSFKLLCPVHLLFTSRFLTLKTPHFVVSGCRLVTAWSLPAAACTPMRWTRPPSRASR